MRTPSVGRLLRASVRQLDSFLSAPEDLVRLQADVLVGARGAVLVGDSWAELHLPERRLEKLGWTRSDRVTALFDPATAEVVVPLPRFSFEGSVAAEIDARWPRSADEDGVRPGRYPLHAIVLLGARPDHLKVASPARRVASLASLLDTSTAPARGTDVAAMGRLDGRVEVVRALGFEVGEVVGILRNLAH